MRFRIARTIRFSNTLKWSTLLSRKARNAASKRLLIIINFHRRTFNSLPSRRGDINRQQPERRSKRARVPSHRSLCSDAAVRIRSRNHLLHPLQAEAEEKAERCRE